MNKYVVTLVLFIGIFFGFTQSFTGGSDTVISKDICRSGLCEKSEGSWGRIVKKYSISSLTGAFLGAFSGMTSYLTDDLFEKNGLKYCNFILFAAIKCFVLRAISQDTQKLKLDFDLRTALAFSFMGDFTTYGVLA